MSATLSDKHVAEYLRKAKDSIESAMGATLCPPSPHEEDVLEALDLVADTLDPPPAPVKLSRTQAATVAELAAPLIHLVAEVWDDQAGGCQCGDMVLDDYGNPVHAAEECLMRRCEAALKIVGAWSKSNGRPRKRWLEMWGCES